MTDKEALHVLDTMTFNKDMTLQMGLSGTTELASALHLAVDALKEKIAKNRRFTLHELTASNGVLYYFLADKGDGNQGMNFNLFIRVGSEAAKKAANEIADIYERLVETER